MTEPVARIVGPLKGIGERFPRYGVADEIFGADERRRLIEAPPPWYSCWKLKELQQSYVTLVPAKATPKPPLRGKQAYNQARHQQGPYKPPQERLQRPDGW